MGKILCLILTLAVVFCLCGCVESVNDDFCVQITCITETTEFRGVGTKIESGYILTVAHIFPETDDEKKICFLDPADGNSYETEILFIDRSQDLALLSGPETVGLTLSENMPSVNEKLYLCFPGEKLSVTYCGNRNCFAEGKPSRLMQLNSYVGKGISGAPLIDKSGTLTGIICARDREYSVSYAIEKETIKTFLEKAIDEEKVISPLP